MFHLPFFFLSIYFSPNFSIVSSASLPDGYFSPTLLQHFIPHLQNVFLTYLNKMSYHSIKHYKITQILKKPKLAFLQQKAVVACPVECPSTQSPVALSLLGTSRGPVTSEPRVLSRTESVIPWWQLRVFISPQAKTQHCLQGSNSVVLCAFLLFFFFCKKKKCNNAWNW